MASPFARSGHGRRPGRHDTSRAFDAALTTIACGRDAVITASGQPGYRLAGIRDGSQHGALRLRWCSCGAIPFAWVSFHRHGRHILQLVGFCSAGACCVLVPEFHAQAALSLLAQERITGVAALPDRAVCRTT